MLNRVSSTHGVSKINNKHFLALTASPNEKWKHQILKLIIGTLQDVLSPQSSQSSSLSYLSHLSLIRSPLPSSVPRSNLLSVQILSQSSSSQSLSLSATVTPFSAKYQIILHNSPTAPPKSQTLTASPPFYQDFTTSLLTICHLLNQLSSQLHQPLHLLQLVLHSLLK